MYPFGHGLFAMEGVVGGEDAVEEFDDMVVVLGVVDDDVICCQTAWFSWFYVVVHSCSLYVRRGLP